HPFRERTFRSRYVTANTRDRHTTVADAQHGRHVHGLLCVTSLGGGARDGRMSRDGRAAFVAATHCSHACSVESRHATGGRSPKRSERRRHEHRGKIEEGEGGDPCGGV